MARSHSLGGRGKGLERGLLGHRVGLRVALIVVAATWGGSVAGAQAERRDWAEELGQIESELSAAAVAEVEGDFEALLEWAAEIGEEHNEEPVPGGARVGYSLHALVARNADALDEEVCDQLFDLAARLADEDAEWALTIRLTQSKVQRRLGRDAAARATLEEASRAYEGRAPIQFPLLLRTLAEWVWRTGEWTYALELNDRAEAGLGDHPSHHAERARILGARAHLWVQMGLPELAAEDLLREREAIDTAIAAFEESLLVDPAQERRRAEHDFLELSSLFVRADYHFATESVGALIRDLEEALSDESRYASLPGGRSRLELQLSVAYAERYWKAPDPTLVESARQAFARADADPYLSPGEKVNAQLFLADLALLVEDWDDAEERLRAVGEAYGAESRANAAGAFHRAAYAALTARLSRVRDGATKPEMRAAQEAALDALLASWAAVPFRPGGVGFLNMRFRRLPFVERVRSIREEGGSDRDERALAELLRCEPMGTMARAMAAPAVTVADVRGSLLPDRGGALIFFGSRYGTLLFALDREQLICEEIGADIDLRDLSRQVTRLATQDPRGLDEAELARRRRLLDEAVLALSDALLPTTVGERLRGWRSVTLVGTEFVGRPLFAVLQLDGRPIGLSHAIERLPSLAVGAAIQHRPAEPPRLDLRVVAAPLASADVVRDLPEIPFDEDDLEALVGTYPKGRVKAHLRAQADQAALSDVGRSSVLHLVTHGVAAAGSGSGISLLLAGQTTEESLVGPERLAALIQADVVVLTACRSSAGPARLGDADMATLSGAVLRSGAHAAVSSDHPVGLESSLALTSRFHEHLRRGDTGASEALRRARVDLVEQTVWQDEFDWGLLEVVGLGHVPVFSARIERSYWAWGAAFFLVVAGAYAASAIRRRAG